MDMKVEIMNFLKGRAGCAGKVESPPRRFRRGGDSVLCVCDGADVSIDRRYIVVTWQ